MIDFGARWDQHLPLVKFVYNRLVWTSVPDLYPKGVVSYVYARHLMDRDCLFGQCIRLFPGVTFFRGHESGESAHRCAFDRLT